MAHVDDGEALFIIIVSNIMVYVVSDEVLVHQSHQSPKQSHAEDHTELIEATSGEDHR